MDFTADTLKEAIARLYDSQHGIKEEEYPQEALVNNLLALISLIECEKYTAACELAEAEEAYEAHGLVA